MRSVAKRVAAVVALGLVPLLAGVGAVDVSAGGPVGGSDTADAARAEHQRIVDFWTPERVARAVPRDFVLDPATGQFRPAAKPGGGGKPGGGSTTPTVSGAPWPDSTPDHWVETTTGKVLFQMGSSYYVCSASVVDDGGVVGRSLIVTAAHCVYDETNRAFATNWTFVPDYDSTPGVLSTTEPFCDQTRFGCWTAESIVVDAEYATAGGFNLQAIRHDFAFVVVGAGGKELAQLDLTTGSHPIAFSGYAAKQDSWAFGYPAASPYDGQVLIHCRGPLAFDRNTANTTYQLGCDMTGGSSGGPWFVGSGGTSTEPTRTQMSVNSYGYSGRKAMYGPIFNGETEALYEAALTAGGNRTV